MKIDALRRFVEMADAGSLYQAAKSSKMSVQGYSRVLASLEKELDVQLALRDQSGIHLTLEGVRFLEFATDTVERFDQLLASMYGGEGDLADEQHQVAVIATHYVLQNSSRLKLLREALADYRVYEMRFDKILERLENPRETEVFYAEVFSEKTLATMKRCNISFVPFSVARMGVVVREGSPLASKTGLHRSELSDLALCTYMHAEWDRHVAEVFHRTPLRRVDYTSSESNLLLNWVAQREDRGFLTDSLDYYSLSQTTSLEERKLCFVPLSTSAAVFKTGAMYSSVRPPSPRVKFLIETTLKVCREQFARYYEEFPQE